MKKFVSLLLTAAMLLTLVCVTLPSKETTADTPLVLTMPDNDGKTNNVKYKLGVGTEDEVLVTARFIPTTHNHRPRPNVSQTMKYIVVHNTGNFNATAGAQAHNNYLYGNSNLSCSYQYLVGSDGIWQNLPDLEYAWHTGNDSNGTGVYHPTAIGIETCDNGAPTKSDGLPAWNTQALYTWYENTFVDRAGYLAILVATLCARYDFNPYTQVVQHFDVFGKECPMVMRHIFGTTSNVGSKLDGTYYKIFWEKMIKYYKAYGGRHTGYVTGQYVITTNNTPIFSTPSRSASKVGSIAIKAKVNVTEVNGDFGKITYNGVTGWIHLQYGVCQNVVGANTIKYVKPVSNYEFTDTSLVEKDGIIYGIKENMSGDALNAACKNTLKVVNANGVQVTSGYVGTGCKVQSLNASGAVVAESYVIVKGDVDGDGQVTQNDYLNLKASIKMPTSNLNTYQANAANITGRQRPTVSDYIAIKRHVQKTFDIYK